MNGSSAGRSSEIDIQFSNHAEVSNRTVSRRDFLSAAGVCALGLKLSTVKNAFTPKPPKAQDLVVYVGTYTTGKSEGIYRCRLDLTTGGLTLIGVTPGIENPSYLTIDRRRKFLYAVSEVTSFEGKPSGSINAYEIDQRTGELRFLNRQPSMGGAPCYITVADSGRYVLVANYVGGNVALFPVSEDGRLKAAADIRQDSGASRVNPQRQEGPHAHCIVLDPRNRYAYACDLGTDEIMIYRFDEKEGKLLANTRDGMQNTAPGAGPRHLTFAPQGRFAYVINELNATVSVFSQDASRGTLREVQSLNTLPGDYSGSNTSADIHITPDGRFLYCSNRGYDHITAFSIDPGNGRLSFIAYEATRGKTPRNFAIDPSGTFLLAANQDSNNVATFRIDRRTGKLEFTGHSVDVPSPVCLKLTAPFG